ncbi:hypothetical protein [Frigidibacter sp.]|uniref:hypothetical protein n=1 Tax=Frigidibacter sp. TaxID=2586418 RepID=UPI00273331C0|nr:hypothetical protein [Frigidibacter sp.]MDP3341185.1 hypothetical protein [Frigidibacter sp.]
MDKFICPGCLSVFSSHSSEISIEHIIPDAANGKLKTFLCKTNCNSKFGVKTAKWLGSYLIHTLDELQDKRVHDQASYQRFVINGAELGGKIWQDAGGLNVMLIRDRPESKSKKKANNPDALRKLDESNRRSVSLSFEDFTQKFVDNERYVKIGMLGAAYFLWFKAFGYSWALQSHLSVIRKMLNDPDAYMPPDGWFYDWNEKIAAIGFALIGSAVYPAANIMGKVVLLPSRMAGMPPDKMRGLNMSWLGGAALNEPYTQGALAPHILMVDHHPIYIPDMLDRAIMEQFFAINYDTVTGECMRLEQDRA